MSAITAPIFVDESLVLLDTNLGTRRLATILRQLSSNAAANARVIVSMQHAIEDIRASMSNENDSIKQRIMHESQLRVQLEDQVVALRSRLSDLENAAAKRDYVDGALNDLRKLMKKATDFIEEIEKGSGSRVTQFVTHYIEEFIPKWYSGVSAEMLVKVGKLVNESSDKAAASLEKRALECEQKAQANDIQMQTMVLNNMYAFNDERKKETSKLRQEFYERIGECDNRMDFLVEKQRFIQGKRHTATRKRLLAIEESMSALRTTLSLEDGLCRELHNMAVRSIFPGEVQSRLYTMPSVAAVVMDDKEIDFNIPGEQRAPDPPELFATLKPDDAVQELRVRRIAQTPHLVGLRTSLQKEFHERLEFLKTDLHNDLVNEIFDIQRELRGKVGTNKLAELLEHYRDESLYSNVKMLMQDMTEVKTSKVDTVLFVEGLRAKADLRALELKVDKAIYGQQIETIDRRVEDLTAASQRHEARIVRAENALVTARRGSIASGLAAANSSHHGRPHFSPGGEGSPFTDDRSGGNRQSGKSAPGKGRRHSGSPQRQGSPFTFQSPRAVVRENVSDDDDQSTTGTLALSGSALKGSAKSIVDQIVERGFPQQVVVQEIRDISKLHQSVVKQSHDRQVEELMVSGAVPNDAGVSTSTTDAAGNEAPVINLPQIATQQTRSAQTQSARQQRAGPTTLSDPSRQSSRLTSASSVSPRSTSTSTSFKTPTPSGGVANKASLIHLTPSQEAYCRAVDANPPPNSGKGFSLGLNLGEKRDY